MKLTVADMRTRVGEIVNLCATDSRVLDYINQACERLFWLGRYEGTTGRFSISATNSMITWPREIDTIERMAVGYAPIPTRNGWYEFLGEGPGILDDTINWISSTTVERPAVCLPVDIPSASKIRIYATSFDATKIVRIQGLDSTGARVSMEYPTSSGVKINGRNMVLVNGYVESPEQWTVIDGIQKPVTQEPITFKAYNTTTLVETTLGTLDPDETYPEFRRSYVPGITSAQPQVVTVLAKIKFRPARVDTDWLYPPNGAAIEQMARAIWLEKNNRVEESSVYKAMAKASLDEQLESRIGAAQITIPIVAGVTFGAGSIAHVQ